VRAAPPPAHTLRSLASPSYAARQRGEGAKGVGRFAKMQTTPVNRYDSGWAKNLNRCNYSPSHFEVRCLHREISFKHCEISRFARNDTVAE